MKKIVFIITLSVILNFISCEKEAKIEAITTIQQKNSPEDTCKNLLKKAINLDTLEYENGEPFLYLKSGNFLSKEEKNALIVYCPNDTTYTIELYTLQNNKWIKNDALANIEAHPTQFHVSFKDYNFDNQNDIYIQETASNGWPFSRAHLLTVNPVTKKLKTHQETRELANMTPNANEKLIYTDELDTYQIRKVNRRINRWQNEKLIPNKIDKTKEVFY